MTEKHKLEWKFATLVLECSVALGGDSIVVAPGLTASHQARAELAADWKRFLSRFDAPLADRCRFFLTARGPSTRPEVLDEENVWLCDRVETVWASLVLCSPGLKCDRGWRLTGRENIDGVSIRESAVVEPVIAAPGTPTEFVATAAQLRQAENLSHVLHRLNGSGLLLRHWRALRAFMLGVSTFDLTLRLHQLVRAIEGVVFIPGSRGARGKLSQTDYFAEKVSLMWEGSSDPAMLREMYATRGAVEHLELPVREIHARPGNTLSAVQAEVPFAEMAFVAEGLARHALVRVLSDERLHGAFSSEARIQEFWNQPADAIRAQWGSPFPVEEYRRRFDRDRAAQQLEHAREIRDTQRALRKRAPRSFWGRQEENE